MRHNGPWKYKSEGRSVANAHELQNAVAKMQNVKPKVRGCLACEHGITVNLGREQSYVDKQKLLPSLVTDSLWTVKFDADGKVMKHHGHDDDGDPRDSERVQFSQAN